LVLNQSIGAFSADHLVNSIGSFNHAIQIADRGDSIIWKNGTYTDIYMLIEKDDIVVMSESPGKVIFNGKSRVELKGNHVTLNGFQYLNGDIGNNNVLVSDGSNNRMSQINIKDYNCSKYLVINEQCERNEVSYCNFEHRMNTWDKNILSILVDEKRPGYHIIKYCSFKNFDGTGGDMGVEPIRIGLSTQGNYISRSIVEYCYFTQCNGDGEIISNKARQNVFRYNTFENNPMAELVLRHGGEGVVYSNFFINGMGGVRIKEGQHHVVFNNYFAGIKRYPINLQNYAVDPLDSITIAYNTIVNSQNIRLGKAGANPPSHVTFANNIFYNKQSEKLFMDETGTETWIGNISYGTLGFARPEGIKDADPIFSVNQEGYYELSEGSPAIDAAQSGYPDFPNYAGLGIDNELIFDLIRNERPKEILLKDVGCIEFSTNTIVKPFATAENTGPFYLHNADTVFSERPNVTGASKVVNNMDDFVEASSDMEGTIYLVKYGLNVTTQTELDSLVNINLGRKAEIAVAYTTIQIFTQGLPGAYYQYYAVSNDGSVSLPSSTWAIVDENGPVTGIVANSVKNNFSAYQNNHQIIVNPGNAIANSLEMYTISGQLIFRGKQLSGIQNIDLNGIEGVLFVRKISGINKSVIKLIAHPFN
ncbi:MAG TPA: chondroitinase-B domain-containing protein, partial [Prolixibacteraceae bacterium]|nr:chondroitinase-B domain-containing protein [Prolixibacteraceae bacterium]